MSIQNNDIKIFNEVEIRTDTDENCLQDCRQHLLSKLFPAVQEIQVEPMSGGLINKMLKCTITNSNEIYVIRVHSEMNKVFLIDSSTEFERFRLLHAHSLGPRVLAKFANGLVYEYVHGRLLSAEELRYHEKGMWPHVARTMANWHSIPLEQQLQQQDEFSRLFVKLRSLLEKIKSENEALLEPIGGYRLLAEQFEALQEKLKQRKDYYRRVLCHNDLWEPNMIVDLQNNSHITFIDYDYAGPCYQALDFAALFANFHYSSGEFGRFPSAQDQRKFLGYYLDSMNSKQSLDELFEQVQDFLYVPLLAYGLMVLNLVRENGTPGSPLHMKFFTTPEQVTVTTNDALKQLRLYLSRNDASKKQRAAEYL